MDTFTRNQLNSWNDNLTNVISKDIFTPPVANRIYTYSNIAAYETIAPSDNAYFGLPARSFNWFFDASNEAAISRLYGGIHHLPACLNGVEQGKKVGKYVIRNLHFQLNDLATGKNREMESLSKN